MVREGRGREGKGGEEQTTERENGRCEVKRIVKS
jgi:hypothetical protein